MPVHSVPLLKGNQEHQFDVEKWIERKAGIVGDKGQSYTCTLILKEQPHTPPFIQFALCAAEQALSDAQWKPHSTAELERTVSE